MHATKVAPKNATIKGLVLLYAQLIPTIESIRPKFKNTFNRIFLPILRIIE